MSAVVAMTCYKKPLIIRFVHGHSDRERRTHHFVPPWLVMPVSGGERIARRLTKDVRWMHRCRGCADLWIPGTFAARSFEDC